MEYLQNGYTLHIPKGCFPLSTDSMLLADFVCLPKNATVLDLGAGCATLGLLLCAKDSNCTVTGIERDQTAHKAALQNIERNQLSLRLSSQLGDLRDLLPSNYHCCVSNPPYYAGGPASQATPTARREDHCSLKDLMDAAGKSLRYGGDLFIVHKPERLAELITLGNASGLEAKRLRLVRHREDCPISLILLHLRKGAKPGLTIEEVFLYHCDGTPSPYYKTVYHLD